MLFGNSLKLTIANILHVFKIAFYTIFLFLIIAGITTTIASKYFSMLVQLRFFDNLILIFEAVFIDFNISNLMIGINSLFDSFSSYFAMIAGSGYWIEICIGMVLTFVFFILVFFYRYTMAKNLAGYTEEAKKSKIYTSIFSGGNDVGMHLISSIILCGIYDFISFTLLYDVVKFLLVYVSGQYLQYAIFIILLIAFSVIRTILFNGWEYIQMSTGESTLRSYILCWKKNTSNFGMQLSNIVLLVVFNWILIILSSIMFGWLALIIVFCFCYLLVKSYGVISYSYFSGEKCYIFGKNVIVSEKSAKGIKY